MTLAVRRFATFAVVGIVWALGVQFGNISPAVLPQITDVAFAVIELLGRETFYPALFATVRDAAIGLAIASILGIVAGVVIGATPPVERSTRLIIDFGRSFPQIALLPIFLLILGANSQMKITLIAIGCFFPILLQSIYGARRMDSTLSDTVRAFRIPWRLRFFRVMLPSASPFILTGFRIAVVVSILVAVAVEITSPVQGIGRELALARNYYETDIAIAYAIYAGILGVLVNAAVDQLERRILRWHLSDKEA
ncbi:ABC transporter permease [Pelagibacterium sp.]|uniref:ABC transporter permease n=1 Tax=Pelagibacterium sp. TaxID=1967288 RepID=UPI003BA86213